MSRIITLTSTTNSATLQIDDEESVTIMSPVTIYQDDSSISFLVDEMSYYLKLADSITIDGVTFSGTLSQLKASVQAIMPTSGGTPTEVTVYQLKTVLTDDQVKALPTTYAEVVPAPGAGKQVLVLGSSLQMKFTDGAYTNISIPSVIGLSYGDWDAEATTVIQFPNDASNMLNMLPPAVYNSPPTGYTAYMQGSFSDRSNIENKPIKVFVDNSGDFTGGNAANTLEVTVFYSIVDL